MGLVDIHETVWSGCTSLVCCTAYLRSTIQLCSHNNPRTSALLSQFARNVAEYAHHPGHSTVPLVHICTINAGCSSHCPATTMRVWAWGFLWDLLSPIRIPNSNVQRAYISWNISYIVVGGDVRWIEFNHKTPRTGDIVPGTIGNLCMEVRSSEV